MARLQASNNATTTLSGNITDVATSLTLTASSTFPDAPFVLTIDSEIIEVGAINKTTHVCSSLLRAQEGTSGAAHLNGAAVSARWTAGMYDELLGLAGGTMAGETIFADQLATRPKLKDYSETTVVANTGTEYTINLESGNCFELTLTGNCVFTFSNPPASGSTGSFTLILKQDATGSRTTTWPVSVKWAGGTKPTLTTTASAEDVLTFVTTTAGTVWYGFLGGLAFAVPA